MPLVTGGKTMKMNFQLCSKADIFGYITSCDRCGHFQQVAYSVRGKCITQICFGCMKVRTNYKLKEKK